MSDLKTQSAIIMKGAGEAQVEHDLSIPSPDAGQILIRTRAVALNPSDWMALDCLSRPGAGAGYDFSGEIVEIGEGVQAPWAVGDRVAGFVHGYHAANYSIGSFREYLTADADLVIHLPDHMSFDAASTLGMGVSTAAQALYQSLGLPLPELKPTSTNQTILIYGGSTATGTLAVQLAKLSGLRVITTCSQQNIPWMRSLGADEVVDYQHLDAIQQAQDYVRSTGLSLIMDCIGNDSTAKFCYQCFTPPQSEDSHQREYIYAPLMPILDPPPKNKSLPSSTRILNRWKFVYTCFGKRFTTFMDNVAIDGTWQPSVEDKTFMICFYRQIETLLSNDKIRVMHYQVREGGLQKVLDGVSLVRAGKIRGNKLAYPIC